MNRILNIHVFPCYQPNINTRNIYQEYVPYNRTFLPFQNTLTIQIFSYSSNNHVQGTTTLSLLMAPLAWLESIQIAASDNWRDVTKLNPVALGIH